MADPVSPGIGPRPHGIVEDAIAIVSGTAFVALGLALYTRSLLLTGGFTGLGLLIQYVSGFEFWLIYFLLNVPLYGLALRSMGRAFVVRTVLAVCLESALVPLTLSWIGETAMNPVYTSIIGGALVGVGLLMLFRHGTCLGGISILALYVQHRFDVSAGYVQLGLDLGIVVAAAAVLPADHLVLSVIGAVVTNVVIVQNHRPDRYVVAA